MNPLKSWAQKKFLSGTLKIYPALFFGLISAVCGSNRIFVGYSQGYTHYNARDFNRAFVLLEKKTRELGGFNPYEVQSLSGHPAQTMYAGYQWNYWVFGFEYEFWSENFAQIDVPFDDVDRDYRVSCAELRSPGYPLSPPSGCLNAEENFYFGPTLLYASYRYPILPGLHLGGGYGIGVLTGSSEIILSTEYIGEDALPSDRVKINLYPGITFNQKVFGEIEYRFLKVLGLNLKGGYRFMSFDEVEVRGKEGNSQVFNLLFNTPENGDKLYITSTAGGPNEDELIIGNALEAGLSPRSRKVGGQFSGWFANLSIILSWSFDGSD